MKRLLAGLAALALLTTPVWLPTIRSAVQHAPVGPISPAGRSSDVTTGTTVTLAVSGMTCATCPITVKQALLKVGGVTVVEMSLERAEAVVTYDPSRTTVASLTRATTNAGYPSTLP